MSQFGHKLFGKLLQAQVSKREECLRWEAGVLCNAESQV